MNANNKQCVLIVDDEVKNRDLLRALMESQDHHVIEAEDGEIALKLIREQSVDVVLLDVMMPKMNGFEVCERIKEEPATAAIPVLMVTAITDRESRLEGIKAGATDFLSKPIDTRDVGLRVRNALHSKGLYDQIQENYRKLLELEQLRDDLTHMVVHDMRSPLTAVSVSLQLVQMTASDQLTEKEQQNLAYALEGTNKLAEMINSLLDVSRLEAGEMPVNMENHDIRPIIDTSLKALSTLTKEITLINNAPAEPVMVSCDGDLFSRVIGNLLSNAVKYTPKGGEIIIKIESKSDNIKVSVTDSGPGIPPDYHTRIFQKFGQVEGRVEGKKYSTGLGLAFCKLAVEAHGGSISVESEEGCGSTFTFTLPIMQI